MKKRTIFLLSLIMIFLLAAPAAAQEEPVQYIEVKVDVLQTGGPFAEVAPMSESSVEDQLYEIICDGIEAFIETPVEGTGEVEIPIDISALDLYFSVDEWNNQTGETVANYAMLERVFKRIEYNNPRWIFLVNRIGCSYEDNSYASVSLFYDGAITQMMPAFNAAIDKAVAEVSGYATDLEKIIAAHNYLVSNCEYNWIVGASSSEGYYQHYLDTGCACIKIPDSDTEIYSAYGALVDGDAVCQGYALAFKLLLDEMGINTVITSSYEMNHAWNLVELDGEWYHVDVTWDDATPDRPSGGNYTYFMLSDATMLTRKHSGWEAWHTCDSTEYESEAYAFVGADTLMHYWNNAYYSIHQVVEDRTYNRVFRSSLKGEKTKVADLGGYHYTALWEDDQLFYVDGFYSDRTFIQLMRCDLTTGQVADVGEEKAFVQTGVNMICSGEGASNGKEFVLYPDSYDLAGLRLSDNKANIEIVSTTRRDILATVPLVDHPIEWDNEVLDPQEKAKAFQPVYDAEEETLEIGILLADEHDVRNLMVAFYNGDKLAGLRMVPVASTDKGLVIVDDMSVAGLPAWDTAKLFAMSGADQEHNGFALCAEVKTLDHTN